MSRFLIWGTGGMATQFYRFYSQISLLQENEIICFIDNDCENKKMFKGIPVISPLDINQYEYDYISIWTPKYEKEIKRQITEELNIPNEKIADIFSSGSKQWEGSPTELCKYLGINLKPNVLTLKLNVNAGRLFREYGIYYDRKRCHGGRKVLLWID